MICVADHSIIPGRDPGSRIKKIGSAHFAVIASEAKQSSFLFELDCRVAPLLAMTVF